MKKGLVLIISTLLLLTACGGGSTESDGTSEHEGETSNPKITSVNGKVSTEGETISISGSGFGNKTQAVPVLYDMGDTVYENGVGNSYHSSFSDGQVIVGAWADDNAIWAKPSRGEGLVTTYSKSRAHRHDNITGHYFSEGPNSFVGWPNAYGGEATPNGNDKLYVSWWYKPLRNPVFYWQWDLSDVTGTFQAGSDPFKPGETLTIESPRLGTISGEVIAIDNNNLHFMAYGATSSIHLRGATIEGVNSGATALLPDIDSAILGPGSNKFIRIWEANYKVDGFLQAWTQLNTTIRKTASSKNIVSNEDTNLNGNEWYHLEVELDLANNRYREWLNSKLHKDIDITDAQRDDSGYSPTIALLGFNGKQQTYQRSDFGEIYMDSTLQRVVIGNSPTYSTVTHAEVQRPLTWDDNNISVEANIGSMESGAVYLYVFDKNGKVNENGFALQREESDASVTISTISGNIVDGEIMTIKGVGFTDKMNDKPLFWWKADDGIQPNNDLGRTTQWVSGSFAGAISTEITAPNSNQSVVFDHGAAMATGEEGAALGSVDFTGSDTLYMYRKLYDDFDVFTFNGIRTWVEASSVTGSFLVGDTVTCENSTATGRIQKVYREDTVGRIAIFYDNDFGTINQTPPIDFVKDCLLLSSSGGTALNIESYGDPAGTYRTFNNKTVRLWNKTDFNNAYTGFNAYPTGKPTQGNGYYNLVHEYTHQTVEFPAYTNPLRDIPFQWRSNELEFKSSSEIDTADGKFNWYQNGVIGAPKTNGYINRTAAKPGKYHDINMTQVSNGAQMGSNQYYDSLYVDDTWHRVILCEGETIELCTDTREIQIPSSWDDNQITVKLNLGGLDTSKPLYLYVFDKNGESNVNGWEITP